MFARELEECSLGPLLLSKVIQANRRKTDSVVEEKIQYGPHHQQYINIYRPASGGTQRSMVFFVHGGGWRMGSPKLFRFIGRFFAQRGFVTALPGYRLAPYVHFPVPLHDLMEALKVSLHTVVRQEECADSVIMAGQSAGAQLAALMTFDRSELERHLISQDIFAGLVTISGPLDFSICQRNILRIVIEEFFDHPESRMMADPIRHISGDEDVPVLCIHGERDSLVDIENSASYIKKLNQENECLGELLCIKGAHHADLLRLFWGEMKQGEYMLDWMRARDDEAEQRFHRKLMRKSS